MGTKNKERTRQYLLKALSTASDFNMTEVRQAIKTAIGRIDQLNEKQIKREKTIYEQWQQKISGNVAKSPQSLTVPQAYMRNAQELEEFQKSILTNIDKMIQDEEDKIKNLHTDKIIDDPNDLLAG